MTRRYSESVQEVGRHQRLRQGRDYKPRVSKPAKLLRWQEALQVIYLIIGIAVGLIIGTFFG